MNERPLLKEELERLIAEREKEDPRYTTIAVRLRELFWDGTCNDTTIRFYRRLQNEAIEHGKPVRAIINQCAQAAQSANSPVRYFAAAVTRRLREQGFLESRQRDLGL